MQEIYRLRIATIAGLILMGLGVFLLAYFLRRQSGSW
jgi:hypothetical protein